MYKQIYVHPIVGSLSNGLCLEMMVYVNQQNQKTAENVFPPLPIQVCPVDDTLNIFLRKYTLNRTDVNCSYGVHLVERDIDFLLQTNFNILKVGEILRCALSNLTVEKIKLSKHESGGGSGSGSSKNCLSEHHYLKVKKFSNFVTLKVDEFYRVMRKQLKNMKILYTLRREYLYYKDDIFQAVCTIAFESEQRKLSEELKEIDFPVKFIISNLLNSDSVIMPPLVQQQSPIYEYFQFAMYLLNMQPQTFKYNESKCKHFILKTFTGKDNGNDDDDDDDGKNDNIKEDNHRVKEELQSIIRKSFVYKCLINFFK